jgi:hypothetical protein
MTVSDNHNIHTRHSNNLHPPQDNLTIYQQRIHYSAIKLFNKLPLEIKKIAGNPNKFKQALRKVLNKYLFYTLEEFYNILYTCLR